MPNGRYILNDMEFEHKITQMNDRELMEFTARQTFYRISRLEGQNHKAFGVTGGLGAFFGAAVAVTVDFFLRR